MLILLWLLIKLVWPPSVWFDLGVQLEMIKRIGKMQVLSNENGLYFQVSHLIKICKFFTFLSDQGHCEDFSPQRQCFCDRLTYFSAFNEILPHDIILFITVGIIIKSSPARIGKRGGLSTAVMHLLNRTLKRCKHRRQLLRYLWLTVMDPLQYLSFKLALAVGQT